MYNRYIPQPDGSYRKNRVPDSPRHEAQRRPPPQPQKQPPRPAPEQETCPPLKEHKPSNVHKPPQQRDTDSITGFFKQLLPKDLDTGDLLIILLLLLMAGDCEEDKNNALLTLALYFFM